MQKCMCFCKLQKQLGSVDTNTTEDEFQREDECSSAYEFKIGPHYVTFYDHTFPIPLPAPVELSISKFSQLAYAYNNNVLGICLFSELIKDLV